MESLGPPWAYVQSRDFYLFVGIAGTVVALLLLLLLAFFVNNVFKRRHEIRLARIESGNLDPMHTQAGVFLVFRRGILLMFLGLNFALAILTGDGTIAAFLPFTLGLAYLTIYVIHASGVLKLFGTNGKGKSDSPVRTAAGITDHEEESSPA